MWSGHLIWFSSHQYFKVKMEQFWNSIPLPVLVVFDDTEMMDSCSWNLWLCFFLPLLPVFCLSKESTENWNVTYTLHWILTGKVIMFYSELVFTVSPAQDSHEGLRCEWFLYFTQKARKRNSPQKEKKRKYLPIIIGEKQLPKQIRTHPNKVSRLFKKGT